MLVFFFFSFFFFQSDTSTSFPSFFVFRFFFFFFFFIFCFEFFFPHGKKYFGFLRRKLRCPRNILHMHTFASFMMRASMALLKDTLFIFGIGLSSEMFTKDGDNYLLHNKFGSNWSCKVFISFWQYFILANYFWILMEGLYLHNLVFLALFTDANSSIAIYVGLGWGQFD